MRHVIFAVVVAAPLTALAQELPVTSVVPETEARTRGTQWTIGLGAAAVPQYQGAEDYRAVPLWNIRAQNLYHPDTYAQLFATMFTSNLIAHSGFRLGPMAQFIPKRGNVDNDRVDDLENVDPSVMLGATLGYDFKLGERRGIALEFLGRQDVANDNGFLGTAQATYRTPLGASWFTTIGVETTYASSDYMQSYFGVDARNADQSGLDEYDADSGIKDVGANLSLGYAFSERWGVTGIGAYRRLVGDAEDSPITKDGDENQWYGGFLVNYRF
jgi:outer membrane protein